MDIPQRLAPACACLASLLLAGCAAHYPYQPYPYQQYPGGYYGQPNYMGPSMGVPPGGVQLNAPTPINPGTTNGGTSGSDAPMWDPDSAGSGSSGSGPSGTGSSNNNVPFYDDPASGDLGPAPGSTQKPEPFKEDKTTFGEDKNPFGMNESSTAETPGVRTAAFEEDAGSAGNQPQLQRVPNPLLEEIPRTSAPPSVAAPDPKELTNAEFERPLERTSAPEKLSLPYNPDEIPNPFGHDPQGFRYLRGLVSYDDQMQAWSIIYNDKPPREDSYGGVFTLADHPNLTVLNDDDVVYVEGSISETLKDEFGKPKYIVEHLTKLKPISQP